MKKRVSKAVSFLAAFILLLSAVTSQAFAANQTNLIQNPGFESGMSNWTKGGAPMDMIMPVTSDVHSGQTALYVGGFAADSPVYSVSQTLTLPSKGQYLLTAFIKYKSTGAARTVTASAGGESVRISQPGDSWQPVQIPLIVKNNLDLTVRFEIDGSGFFLLDDVSLVRTGDLPSLINNGDFEQGLDNWTTYGGPSALSTTAQAHGGTKSVYFGYFANEGLQNYIGQDITIGQTGNYTFSAYIKTDANLSGIGAALFVEALDTTGKVIASATSSAVSDSAGAWVKQSVTLRAPAGTQTVRVKIGGVYCVGSFYVDDVKLEIQE